MSDLEAHSRHSTLREHIVEHLLIGELLRRLWQRGIYDVEVLRSEFDAGGYDLVVSRGGLVRHVQFKSVVEEGKNRRVSVSLRLAACPSGCVLWMVVTPQLKIAGWLWFGGRPGEPLPAIEHHRTTRHTKPDMKQVKKERPDHRIVSRTEFRKLASIDEVIEVLFGIAPPSDIPSQK
ncbi:MAG: hypothetical protein LWW93_00835 [Hyphomicrobiales bacterium]|nr:hypothetical protein [Hyphomicrobiales bacterium]